jgi:hypothetical protein
MSNRKRRHPGRKPSERRAPRESPESRTFREAMAGPTGRDRLRATLAEYVGAERAAQLVDMPCFVCGDVDVATFGFWAPDPRFIESIRHPLGKKLLLHYLLCEGCASRLTAGDGWIDRFIEAKWGMMIHCEGRPVGPG